MKVSFKEEQKFTQWRLKAILYLAVGIVFYSLYVVISAEDMNISGKIIFGLIMLVTGLGPLLLVAFWKMETTINQEGIYMKNPLAKKKVLWNELEDAEVIDYGFIGYGIRYGSKYGTVFNTSGKMGLVVKPKGKKQFVIGTQRPDELKRLIEKWKSTSLQV